MKSQRVWSWTAKGLAVACLLTGCQSAQVRPVPAAGELSPRGSATLSVRDNACALLHQLLNEEKDISFLHFIKREHTSIRKLMTQIGSSCGKGAKLLEQFAKDDASINLQGTDLPPGEVAARAAIAVTKKHALLENKGSDFELNLLLTQTEALNYGWHLAEVASKNEPQPEHARALADLAEELHNLYNAVCMQLLSKEW